jgi:hypothetical protein
MDAFTPGVGKSLIYKRSQTPRVLRNTRVRNVGDVNGDGITDMAVSAIAESSYLFFGRRDLVEELDFEAEVAEGRALRLLFDQNHQGSFAPLGDVTGDAIDDFVISTVADKVLFLEGRRLWPEELDLEDEAASFARFVLQVPGFAANIAQVGDVNGDGRPDLLLTGNSSSSLKPVYLIYGLDPTDLPQEERIEDYLVLGGGVIFEWRGRSATNINPMNVSGVGDVNGDGLADLLIGDEEGGVAFEGITYLIHGRRDFPERVVLPATMEPIEMEGVVRLVGQRQSGRALGPAGDYNGDGYPDFTVGTMDPKIFPPGKIDVVFGSPDLPAVLELGDLRRHGFRLEGVHSTTLLTETARVRGDLNGDGAADFAFSEWRDPAWRPEDGSVHVVFGIPPSVPFIRGDSDGDGRLNITDGVFTLSHLFLGGVNPLCEDATDADDRGTVELTDAVYLLNHLFLGGSEPPAPYPLPGNDPTEDRLGCRGF